ncbi:hypothetical protein Tco_0026870 [Tanacetum coccineum]
MLRRGEQGIRVVAPLRGIHKDLYALLEDVRKETVMEWERGRPMLPARLGLVRLDEPGDSIRRLQTHRDQVYAQEILSYRHTDTAKVAGTLSKRTDCRRLGTDGVGKGGASPCHQRYEREMKRHCRLELLALREQRRTAGQSGPEARIPDHQEGSGDADSHI